MFPVKHRKKFYIFSGITLLASYLLIAVWGFNIGTDFRGGAIAEVYYKGDVPNQAEVERVVGEMGIGNVSVRSSGQNGFIVRTKELSAEEQEGLRQVLSFGGTKEYNLERLNSVGPAIGKELTDKALIAIAVVIAITVLYIAYTFRQISRPVSSWGYGLVAILALIHDITIPAGFAVVLGRYSGMEVDALFISALLSLLGYSINDTIIIFDRIRTNLQENKEKNIHESFENTVGKSLSETYGRSINTSLTVFLVLVSLMVFGSASIKFFILTLIIGTIAGAYSSIFLAAPLLVSINNRNK